MSKGKIQIQTIISAYDIDISLVQNLEDIGRISIIEENDTLYISDNQLDILDKMLRMNADLNLNAEGIDTVLHLLERIEELQNRIAVLSERTRLMDEDWNDFL